MESSHWDTFKTRQDRNDILSEYSYGLPRSLNALIKQDDHLSLYQETTSAKVKIQRSPAFSQVTKYLEQITTKLYLIGCQRYSENEVMRLPHRNPPSNFQFLAYIGGRWASCYQFGSRKAQIYAIMYWLQVSHCLRGTPGIRTPVGVVVDPESGIVNSVLTELPAGGKLFRLTTEPISWIRRLAWCKQLVEAVLAVHAGGFVVGKLGDDGSSSIFIDGQRMSSLTHFEQRLT